MGPPEPLDLGSVLIPGPLLTARAAEPGYRLMDLGSVNHPGRARTVDWSRARFVRVYGSIKCDPIPQGQG